MMGIIGAMLAFVAFGLLYVTYTLERYNIMFALALTFDYGMCGLRSGSSDEMEKTGVVVRAVTVLLLLVQSFLVYRSGVGSCFWYSRYWKWA